MKNIQDKFGTSIILITHDLGVVADMSDRVIVMYAGQLLEEGLWMKFLKSQMILYSKLLGSVPRLTWIEWKHYIPFMEHLLIYIYS